MTDSCKGEQAPQKMVYIETVGCQMNVLDSELVIAALKKDGYRLTDSPARADLILFNTCSVRELAEEKTYSAVGRVTQHKRNDPTKILGVIGCMAQKDQELVRERQPLVDLVVGTGQLAKIPELVRQVRDTGLPQYAVSLGRKDAGRHEVEASFESYDPARDPEMRTTPFQAYVRVQIGCDKFCTYCVVPSTRGPEQSRNPDHIVHESRVLVEQGCKEITLIGQTVNSYLFDHGDGRRTRFSDLIARLHDISGLERIKFVTNFPKDMTNDLLDAVRELPKVVKYLHVPLQSGCDEVLKRMKRQYTVAEYHEMLHRARERVPGVAVSSDFIVGFCGETEESFQKTLRVVHEDRFKNSYIFKYSERSGTKAAERYPDDVPEAVKRRRNNELLEVQDANSLNDHRTWIGKTVQVLVEGRSKRDRRANQEPTEAPQLTGHSMTDHIVVFNAPERLIGQILTVDIEDAGGFTLYGRVRTDEVTGVLGNYPPARVSPMRRIGLNVV
jgi:tRNA-2-methylthio-N6-dimethylallyladenosine synthase